jgi:hypothetical protein
MQVLLSVSQLTSHKYSEVEGPADKLHLLSVEFHAIVCKIQLMSCIQCLVELHNWCYTCGPGTTGASRSTLG